MWWWFEAHNRFAIFSGTSTQQILSRYSALFLILVTTLFVAACQQPETKVPSPAETQSQYILGDSGIFRGHQMGNHLANMAVQDRNYLFARNTDELRYSIPFSTADSSYFDVLYAFKNEKLYEIQVDILLGTSADSLFAELKKTLTTRHGKPHERGDYAYWEISQNSQKVELSLRDESEMRGRPYLSLNFFEPQIFVH